MKRSIQRARQLTLDLPTWGGRRAGAGPKPMVPRDRPALPHRARMELRPYEPAHVSVRMRDHVWNLRSQRSYAVIHRAFEALRRRTDLRIPHWSIQGNHLHMITEANGTRALATGMQALSIRIARGLNAMMGRCGPVLEDRYHVHPLRTPAEVRNAVRYVLGNFESHAARRGEPTSGRWVDPFSSATGSAPRTGQGVLFIQPVAQAPRTWLLRNAGTPRT